MTALSDIRQHIISRLKNALPTAFTYHSLEHTLDVETQCMIIAKKEGITMIRL